ncbi:hypothetical protein E3J62_09585 [candidate division TA06 bacterium]|uniref:Uncharacterized protein n=1 Tax=candidate division TA06 bacterium TaxID=2250710 RepID=A0A523UQA1_UNCT6|nr:MAG: hypothetical protein E3J62_09585 [candidate division TA06 bacterium]
MKKENLESLYEELQGYLSQAPWPEKTSDLIADQSVWEQYNHSVELLTDISGRDYSRFLVKPWVGNSGRQFVGLLAYRQKLGGLISSLHAEYFSKKPAPFSSVPETVVTQSQQQVQSVYAQVLLEIDSKIDEMIPSHQEGSKERSFLQKVKSSLKSASNVAQLLALFFRIAKECGLNIDDVLKVFG